MPPMRGNRPNAADLPVAAPVHPVIPECRYPDHLSWRGLTGTRINVRMAESRTLLAEAETLLAPLSVDIECPVHISR